VSVVQQFLNEPSGFTKARLNDNRHDVNKRADSPEIIGEPKNPVG
jgi:cobalamin biosynthesis protein CobT